MTDGHGTTEPKLTPLPYRELPPKPGEAPRPERELAERAPEARPPEAKERPPVEITGKRPGLLPKMRRPTRPIPQVRDEVTLKIEKILEDGLGDAWSRLSPLAQQEFKVKGEETAQAIRALLRAAHVKVKKIFRLILEWLKMLPGINRFYLQQEAKIKTDRLIELHKQIRH